MKYIVVTIILAFGVLLGCISERTECSRKLDSPIDNVENTKLIWFAYRRCQQLKEKDPQLDQDCDSALSALIVSLSNYKSCENKSDIPTQPNLE